MSRVRVTRRAFAPQPATPQPDRFKVGLIGALFGAASVALLWATPTIHAWLS